MAKAPKDTPEDASENTASDASTPAEAAPTAPGEAAAQGPMLRVLAQYTKDVSFENPNAPESLRSDQPTPEVNIGIEIARQMMGEDRVEVVLVLKAEARRPTGTAFICELEYAGLFQFRGASIETIQPLILIECPRLLFPFARQIMAELTQGGGFPPIMLEPPDFAAMFREEVARRAQQGNAQQAAQEMGEPQGSA